jgi:hypothetical protein
MEARFRAFALIVKREVARRRRLRPPFKQREDYACRRETERQLMRLPNSPLERVLDAWFKKTNEAAGAAESCDSKRWLRLNREADRLWDRREQLITEAQG